jgi:hypothetical protein
MLPSIDIMRRPRGATLVLLLALTSCGKSPANISDPGDGEEPPPNPPGVVFESSWSSGTGSTETVVKDGGNWPALTCINTFPTVLTVLDADDVGFDLATNVLRVQMRGPTACGMLQKNDAVPISTTHWGRFYFRNDENGTKNDHPVAYHNIHGADDIQGVPFTRHANRLPEGQWQPGVVGAGPYPNNKWYGPALDNGTWYRYEWQMEYVTPTTVRVHPRIYNMAGTLIHEASSFINDLGSMNLQQWYDAGNTIPLANGGTPNAELARNFGMGNEGPGSSTATMGYWYYARFALSTAGWIGQ